MELEFKPDLEEVRQRWDQFWYDDGLDRPMAMANIPKPGVEPVSPPHQYNLPTADLEAFADRVYAWGASREFLGDAIPYYGVSFAPDHLALLLEADMEYAGSMDAEGTAKSGWIIPFLKDYDQEIRFRPEGKWWETTVACIRALRKRCDGSLIIAGTHLQGGLDALAAIRDPQALMMDMLERPEDVERTLTQIDRAVNDVRAALGVELGVERFGTITRHYSYSSTWTDVPQCDFSCMISQGMFRQFGIPSLRSDCDGLVGAVYHLDGPGAIRHLPALCEIEKIRVIQWQPGAGAPATADWSDLYREIDERGKGQLRRGPRKEMLEAARQCKSRHLMLFPTDVTTRSEMDQFMQELEQARVS